MKTKSDSTTQFKFRKAHLVVNRVRPNLAYLIAHNRILAKGGLARHNLTSVDLKSFTNSAGPNSLSIENAVLGQLPKRLLFTVIKNKEFVCSLETNP